MNHAPSITLALAVLAGPAVAACDEVQTFHNGTGWNLVLVAKPGPSPFTFLLTLRPDEREAEVICMAQYRVCPAGGELPRVVLHPGASVDFARAPESCGPALAHFCLYQEGTLRHLGRLDFVVLPGEGGPMLYLEVTTGALKAVAREICPLSLETPGWSLKED